MGRLKTSRPRLSAHASSSGRSITRADAERSRMAARDADREWRSWYDLARWKRLREAVLEKGMFTCAKTGTLLRGKPPAPDSPVVDHIRPHNGNPDLFWDEDNLQLVSKAWHDSRKQAIERAGQAMAIHPKWLQPSAIPLTIICGPPCSGKTTLAEASAGPGDLVIDLDRIASDLSGEPMHGWPRERWLNAALWQRNNLLGGLSRPGPHAAAWFVVSEPKARHREWWASTLRPQRIIVLEVDEPECMARALAGGRDLGRVEARVMEWWAQYGRRIGDDRRPGGQGGGGASDGASL
uniref:AAA family ATPase n=1 Tax=Mangrovicoccus sp. HB161399 TaxID=2720392 RepID=UPI001555C9FB